MVTVRGWRHRHRAGKCCLLPSRVREGQKKAGETAGRQKGEKAYVTRRTDMVAKVAVIAVAVRAETGLRHWDAGAPPRAGAASRREP